MEKIRMSRKTLKHFAAMAAEAYVNDPVYCHAAKNIKLRKKFIYHFMIERLSSSNGEDLICLDEENRGIIVWRDAHNDYTVFDFLKCPNWVFLVVYLPYTIKALITYSHRNLKVFPKNTLLIEPVFVDKKHQGKGIATALITKGIKELQPLGYTLGLETQSPDNVRFYEKLGFEVINCQHFKRENINNYSMIYKGK